MNSVQLGAEEILKINVICSKPLEVGKDSRGTLKVIPIEGGHFEGVINGIVVSGGADWNTEWSEGAHVFAKYLLKTDDGQYIAIENEGIILNDKSTVKTTPRFRTEGSGKYGWLNYGVYAGSLKGKSAEEVEIIIYKMK